MMADWNALLHELGPAGALRTEYKRTAYYRLTLDFLRDPDRRLAALLELQGDQVAFRQIHAEKMELTRTIDAVVEHVTVGDIRVSMNAALPISRTSGWSAMDSPRR